MGLLCLTEIYVLIFYQKVLLFCYHERGPRIHYLTEIANYNIVYCILYYTL